MSEQTNPFPGCNERVTYALREQVAWIGLNRPEKRNAIDVELLAKLGDAVQRAGEEARAMVIHGHGSGFSAGLDLEEHGTRTAEAVFHHSRQWHRVFGAIRRSPIPAIAAIHGAAVGGGLELAAACHLRVADDTAFFALPEGKHGIYVGGGASVHVARLIGAARMTDMMLTGRVLNADAALEAGLLQYRVPALQAMAKAGELAVQITGTAPLTVLGVLQALPRIQDMGEEDGLFVESLVTALAQSAPEAVSRLADFAAKRGEKVTRP